MTVLLNPYLHFRDGAREALEFYQSALGGKVEVMTFGDGPPMPGLDPADAPKVMHGALTTDDGLTLYASDTPASMAHTAPDRAGITVSLSGDDVDRLRGYWEALSDGGEVSAPFEQAPWGAWFGMVTDRFGIPWLVNANIEG